MFIRFLNLLKSSFSIVDQLLLSGFSFVLTFYLARTIDVESFALFAIVFTFQNIIIYIYNSIIGQFILLNGNFFGNKEKWWLNIFLLIIGITVSFLLLKIAGFWSNSLIAFLSEPSNVASAVIYMVGLLMFENFRRFLYSNQLFKRSLFYTIVAVSLIITLQSFFILNLKSIFLIVGVIFICLSQIGLFFLDLNTFKSEKLEFSFVIQFSKWLLYGAIFYIIGNRIFIFILDGYSTSISVAQFRLIENIFAVSLVLVISMENLILVKLKNLKIASGQLLTQILLYFTPLIVLVVGLGAIGSWITDVFFNEIPSIDTTIFLLAAASYSIFIINRSFSILMRLQSLTKAIFTSNILSALSILTLFIFDDIGLLQIFIVILINYLTAFITYCYYYFKKLA